MGFVMPMTHKKLGRLLAVARKKQGLSQGNVGRKLGYTSAQFVSNFERGRCAPPLSKLRRMISLYELEPEAVMQVILAGTKKELRSAIR